LDAGRIVASGTPAELAAGAVPRLRFRLARGLDDGELSALGGALAGTARAAPDAPADAPGGPAPTLVAEPGEAPGAYRLDGPPPDPALVATLAAWCAGAGVQIVELRAAAATLEERYLELTGDRDVEDVI
ncbi:MAG TPA: hypothetical protein VFV53_07840, partial [Candidatus Limnocylindrales bacterium]|nr:hypothetical protein [Candidatus Limnocylindrales bacterium]